MCILLTLIMFVLFSVYSIMMVVACWQFDQRLADIVDQLIEIKGGLKSNGRNK